PGSLAGSLTFRDSYTLSGGTLSVASGNWNVQLGHRATIDSILTGDGGFTLNGGGVVRLNNALNDFTGTTTLNNGILVVSNPAALGSGTSAIVIRDSNPAATSTAVIGFAGGALALDGTGG